MDTQRGTINFQLFGVPVSIRPSSWLVLALLGGGLHMQSAGDLQGILIFVVAGMLVLITHEFGHALVGRALGGRPHAIVVEGFGAVTHSDPPPGRWPYFMMVLAGPLATLLPGIAAGLVLGVYMGVNPLAGVVFAMVTPLLSFVDMPMWVLQEFAEATNAIESEFALQMYLTFFTVSVWWCLFNLLPVFPMDGGKLLMTVCRNYGIVFTTGGILAGLLTIWSLMVGGIFGVMLFGYFAWLNWTLLRTGGRG